MKQYILAAAVVFMACIGISVIAPQPWGKQLWVFLGVVFSTGVLVEGIFHGSNEEGESQMAAEKEDGWRAITMEETAEEYVNHKVSETMEMIGAPYTITVRAALCDDDSVLIEIVDGYHWMAMQPIVPTKIVLPSDVILQLAELIRERGDAL